MEFRIEHDTMGEVKVPRDALWRAQTQRAVQNFPISGRGLERAQILALGLLKAAAARVNRQLGVLDGDVAEAIDKAAEKTGQQAGGVYEQAKTAASDAYDSASEYAGDAVARVQDGAADIDDMVSEQVGRHPKAMVALGVGIGFALGILFASSRQREPSWRDYAKW